MRRTDRARASRPTRRRRLSVRRAALLVAGSGLALVGLVVLVVIWIGLATASLRAGLEQDGAGSTGTAGASACVTAATAGEGDAVVTSSMLPPRAVCVRTVDGRATETVLAEGSTVLAAGAMVAVGSGLVLLVGTLVGSVVVARRRVAGVDPSGVAVDPSTAPPAPARARRPEQPTE